MDHFQIEEALESMVVLVDTREQPTERAKKRYAQFGCPYRRQKLNYGDYSYSFCINGHQRFYDYEQDICPKIVIERKMNLEELSQCFCQDRKRFEAEFERAKEHDAKVFLLVENATWEKIIHGRYKTKFNSAAYFSSLMAWVIRYGIVPIFCQEEITGKIIKEIFYRDFKEKLERGDFDWCLEDT